jgi:hypothetical protein
MESAATLPRLGHVARRAGAAAVVAALVVAVAGCGSPSLDDVDASMGVNPAGPSRLDGDWPAEATTTTTTTTTAPPETTTTTPPETTAPPEVNNDAPGPDDPDANAGPDDPDANAGPDDPDANAGPDDPDANAGVGGADANAGVGGATDPGTGLGIAGPIGPSWPSSFTVADAAVASVDLYASPGNRVPDGRSLSHPTHEAMPLVMLVRDETDDGQWLQVQIPSRPNGATAWIRADDVDLRTVPHHVIVELGAKTVTVYSGNEEIFSAPMAPGKASSPTPTGAFYVDARAKPPNPNGPYGHYQVSFSGFSNVHTSFGGGNGQAAMHGTNRPELIGTPASAGCVRLTNEDVTTLVDLAPTGTPVTIVA